MVLLIVGLGLVPFALAFYGVGRFRKWAERRRILDVPNERSSHTRPTPRGGGMVIVAVTLAGIWAFLFVAGRTDSWLPAALYTLGAALIAGVGWLDDLRRLPNSVKFGAQSLGAVLLIVGYGPWKEIALPYLGSIPLGWAGWLVTFLWIAGVTNAFNFMDGIDGIAASQAAGKIIPLQHSCYSEP